MDTLIAMFWHFEAERLHVFVELNHYTFNAYYNPLNGLEVHSTKFLRDIWIISLYEPLDEFLHSGMLVFSWVSEDILKNKVLDVC
jgi:hypothetical protein